MSSATVERISDSRFSNASATASATLAIISVEGPCLVKGLFWHPNATPGTGTPLVATLNKFTKATGALAAVGPVLTTATPPVAGKTYYKLLQTRIDPGEIAMLMITAVPTAGQGVLSMEVEVDGFHGQSDTTNLVASTT
jgi:hypothetical protein